jgi:serine/threonine-protein kinase
MPSPSSAQGAFRPPELTRPKTIDVELWKQVLPLLDVALDQPPAGRTAWLAALDSPEEVKAALRHVLAGRDRPEAQGFLEALPDLQAGGQAPAAWPPGDRVGPYRLIRELGRGGMSVVWLAERDDGQLRRQVALKFPHPGPHLPILAERLHREHDFLAGLTHRNIARLYDVGTTPEGLPFLILEYVEGESIVDHCDARRLSIGQRLQLFMQVLRAVQHAHGMLVLHRDIKPSNILINRDGDAKLLDFGIAKLLTPQAQGAGTLTGHGGRVMTPDYAAPEQICGAA